MKKILLFAFSLLIAVAFYTQGYSSPKTKCYGDCNKIKRDCESKAKNTKYKTKTGFKEAMEECQKKSDECSAKCKDVK